MTVVQIIVTGDGIRIIWHVDPSTLTQDEMHFIYSVVMERL